MPKITENQYGTITDLISEGEIEGVVGGQSGIYYNGVALSSEEIVVSLQGGLRFIDVSGTSITNANGLFAGIDLAGRGPDKYIQIQGAGRATTLDSNVSAGSDEITVTTSNFFLEKHTKHFRSDARKVSLNDNLKHTLRIEGAGPDGREYVGVITGFTGSFDEIATIYPPIGTSVSSGAAVSVDEVKKLVSIGSSDTATLDSAVETDVTQARAKLSSGSTNSSFINNQNDNTTYDNAWSYVKRGSITQLPFRMSNNTPSASYIIGVGQDLSFCSLGTIGGNQAPTFISSTSFNFGQNSVQEIDKLQVDIEFPGGLQLNGRDGESRNAYAEFQIILLYKTSSTQSNFTKELIHGFDYGGSEFIDGINVGGTYYWNKGDGETSSVYDKFDQYKDFYERGPTSGRYRKDVTKGSRGDALISKKGQNTSFIASYEIDLKDYKPLFDWQIEIRRVSPSKVGEYTYNNNSFIAKAVVKSVTASITDLFSYPGTSYAVSAFSAKDFSSPPARAYHLRGKKIAVPDNYITREELSSNQAEYTRNSSTGDRESSYQSWTGGFRQELVYTNNPAWVFYDILTNTRYGLGDFLKTSDIDIFALYQIGRYCDELVPDGKGGLEPRFSCNVYLKSQQEAYKVLKDLNSTFRSMMFWIDGKITSVQDKPKEPVYTFTQGNVENGLFDYTYTGQRARTNQVNVSWNDPTQFYKQTVLTIDDTANIISQNRIVSKDVVAFGCTSQGQARRVGNWHLATDTKETEIVSFTTSINASFLRPGDIINVQDKNNLNIEASGRVSTGSTTTSINLDRLVDFPGSGTVGTDCNLYLIFTEPSFFLQQESATINGQTYERGALLLEDSSAQPLIGEEQGINLLDDSGDPVVVQYSKNTRVEVKEITNSGTSASTITVLGAFTSAPEQDTIWAISRQEDVSTQEIKEFRIAGITEENGYKYSIAATQYLREKFDEIEIDKPVFTTKYVAEAGRNEIPPEVGTVSVVLENTGSFGEESVGSSTKAVINWSPAVETFTDSLGTTSTIPYRFLGGYKVIHDLRGKNEFDTETVIVPAGQNTLEVSGVEAGTYRVTVITLNDGDPRTESLPKTVIRTIFTAPPQNGRITRISKGGFITSSISFNSSTGLLTIEKPSYTYSPPSGVDFFSTAGSPLFNQEDFSSLGDGETAYFFYDASSAEAGSDPWKAVQLHIDNINEDPDGNITRFTYIKDLGSSTNGLTAISGTVNTVSGSNIVTGSSTTFTSDFSEGDFIKVSSNSSAGTEVAESEYREIVEITDNETIVVKYPFLRTQTAKFGFKQTVAPDVSKDVILAEISRTGSIYSADVFVQTRGENGASVDIIFQRSATQPEAPDPSEGLPGGSPAWYTNPPSGTQLLWASKGTKDVGDIEFTWGTPYQVEGSAVVEIAIYKKDDSNTPMGGSYNFTTNSLNTTGLTVGWSQTPPSLSNNLESVYKSVALFVGSPEETSASATWSAPAVIGFRQDGSIGNDAKAVKLTPSSFVINYSTAGAESDSITFTTTVQSISGSPTYSFLVDGVEKQNSTTSTFTLADADEPDIGEVVEVSVEVYDTTPSLLATDSVSIYAVQDGSDAIIGFLTNTAHTVSADNSGTVSSFSGAGGTFKVFVGGTEVTTSCTFSVVGNPANTTTSIDASTGVYDITALSANQDNVTYQAVIPAATAGTSSDVTITSIYSISKSIKGNVGDDGASLDIIFQRYDISQSPSSPTAPSPSSGTPSGWDTNPPAGTDTLFASQGVKAVGATNFTWGTPYQVEGTSVAEVYIYRKNNSDEATGGSYDFTTNTLTQPTDWSIAPPALTNDGDEVYVAVGLFSGPPTATSATTTWSTPVVYAKRTDGISADVDIIFQRYDISQSPSSPTAPSPSSGTPSGWDTNPPAGTDTLFASNGTKEGGATNYTWSTPYQIEGTSVAEVYIYRKNNSDGATGGSYDFTTNTLTQPTDWSIAPPALDSDTDKIYVAVGLFSGPPTATSATTTWSTPVVYAERQDGTNGVALNLTASPVSFAYDGSAYDPDGTSTVSLSASGGTITSVTYSDDVAAAIGAVATGDTAGSTFTFQNDLSLANAKASATVTAAVTGTDSKGNTEVSFGSISAKIPVTIQGTDGVSITGPRTTTGHIYYQSSTVDAPDFPSEDNVTYNWSTGRLSGGVIGTGSTNWNQNPPTFASGNSNKYWYVPYSVTEASFGGQIAVDFVGSTVYQGIGFSGLVTFTSGELTDGVSTFNPADKIDDGGAAADVNSNITTINGGKITTDSITATQLQISNLAADPTGNEDGIFLDGTSNNIKIFANGVLRVKIGSLS